MSERKRKPYDIKEIHEFIDSASTATQHMHYTQNRKNLDAKRKKKVREPVKTRKHPASSENVHSKSGFLTPKVVVRKREPMHKQEEIVFHVADSPKIKKKQEILMLARVAPTEEELFSEEALYEIEPYISEEESPHAQQKKEPEPSSYQDDATPAVSLRRKRKKLPEWKSVQEPSRGEETWANKKTQMKAESLPEFEHVDEEQASPHSHDDDKVSSDESLEIETTKEQEPSEDQAKALTFKDKSKMKAQEKQAILELKRQEREARRFKKEQETKKREEERAVEQRLQAEERLKEEEKRKAAVEAQEKQREEQRLLKEREKNLRAEQREVQRKEKEEQKRQEEEKKKTALAAREKQKEEQRLLKEREKNQLIEQREVQRKEKEEQKQKKEALKRTSSTTAHIVSNAPPHIETTSDETFSFTSEPVPEAPAIPHDENHPADSFQQPIEQEVPPEDTLVPATAPEQATPDVVSPREDRREQRCLRKEQKEKQRLERIAVKEKEKQERQQRKQQERLPERVEVETRDKAEQKRKRAQEKLARQDTKRQDREMKKQQKLQVKLEQQAIAVQQAALRRKEKEQQQQHEEAAWKMRQDNADIQRIDSREQQADHALQKVVEQQQVKEAEQQAIEETKEQRKLKALERKMQKEQEKREKDAQKIKMRDEENAKKRMELHFEEQLIKEKQTQESERITIFDGFDSIDQDTAKLLYRHGYSTVEKLLQATLEDLKKIGIKKKIAKDILDECLEFVEWKVMDAENPNEKIGGVF